MIAKRIFTILTLFTIANPLLQAEDLTLLGGDMTSFQPGRHAIQTTAPNVPDGERKELQLEGFTPFHAAFSATDNLSGFNGLGPLFNHSSCGSCHVNNGRGKDLFGKSPTCGFTRSKCSSILIKVAEKNSTNEDGSPVDIEGVGEQIRNHGITKSVVFDHDIEVTYKDKKVKYPDGRKVTLRKPIVKFKVPGRNGKVRTQRKVAFSMRMSPPIIGPGLLEAIPEDAILALADPEDLDQDGISGKPQYVPDRASNTIKLGRFGFRASHTTLEQQSAAAAFHDMGVTNTLFPGEDEVPEMSDDTLHAMAVYLALAGVPAATTQDDPQVVNGQELFRNINCSGCHTMAQTTGESEEYPEVSNHEIHPFTDLLLHDMGPDLADKRAEFEATGREWRTTPLWGIGKVEDILTDEFPKVAPFKRFLHDGRARTIEEAILWHGGEAQASKEAFMDLSASERSDLIKFLESL